MMDDKMTVRQVKRSLEQMIDFTASQLSRNLQNEERTYYSARKFALTECLQMVCQLEGATS